MTVFGFASTLDWDTAPAPRPMPGSTPRLDMSAISGSSGTALFVTGALTLKGRGSLGGGPPKRLRRNCCCCSSDQVDGSGELPDHAAVSDEDIRVPGA